MDPSPNSVRVQMEYAPRSFGVETQEIHEHDGDALLCSQPFQGTSNIDASRYCIRLTFFCQLYRRPVKYNETRN